MDTPSTHTGGLGAVNKAASVLKTISNWGLAICIPLTIYGFITMANAQIYAEQHGTKMDSNGIIFLAIGFLPLVPLFWMRVGTGAMLWFLRQWK